MQTTRVSIHPRYAIFMLGTFFGLDLGTMQSILVANTLASVHHAYYTTDFWNSVLLWAVSFFILGAIATDITGVVRRGIVMTCWSSLVAGFVTFITSLIVVISQLDLSSHPSFRHSYDRLGLLIYFMEFFCLWLCVMFCGLAFGSLGAGLYRAIQKIATRSNSAGQLKY